MAPSGTGKWDVNMVNGCFGDSHCCMISVDSMASESNYYLVKTILTVGSQLYAHVCTVERPLQAPPSTGHYLQPHNRAVGSKKTPVWPNFHKG